MLTDNEVKRDLDFICAQTNAHWLSFANIHTHDPKQDVCLYLREMNRLGYSKYFLFLAGYIQLSYGGGLEIKHQEEMFFSGYTMNGYQKNKNKLVILSGFDTDNDKHTVYHECAHLLQFKYNIFNINSRDDYTTYLTEVHANTFADMVLFLKSANILEYKKRRLGRFADGVNKINDNRADQLYYLSLPIELELMKEIRRNGRLNTLRQFQKKGYLDFKKIIFYTKDLVQKYAYSPEEFEQIKTGTPPLKHLMLQKKAKAYRILGKAYWEHEFIKYKKESKRHTEIEKQRINARLKKVERLPGTSEKNQIINELCTLDCYQVEMTSEYEIFNSLEALKNNTVSLEIPSSLKETPEKVEVMAKTFEKMCAIYQKYKDNEMFQSLFEKLETFDGRDEIWALKEKARPKEISVSKTLVNEQKTR